MPLADLCHKAGLRLCVSGAPTKIRLHEGPFDFKAVAPGQEICCVSVKGLPQDQKEQARAILDKLAYQFFDWASREIVAAANREKKRRLRPS